MIPFNFDYYRPGSVEEAAGIFNELDRQGKNPVYYGGGTEIISLGRMANISVGSVIDLKDIPECRVQEIRDNHLIVGAGVTLTQIHESNLFPLLARASARVADHTIQNKITLGGNLCGTIIYRECVLPLLLADAEIITASAAGMKTQPLQQRFKERMELDRGEFLVQVKVPDRYLSAPHIHVKRTKQDKINYPLITLCAMRVDNFVRAAFSGLCASPLRSAQIEERLNEADRPAEARAENALKVVPWPIYDDLEGSADYRRFVLKNLLVNTLNELER